VLNASRHHRYFHERFKLRKLLPSGERLHSVAPFDLAAVIKCR